MLAFPLSTETRALIDAQRARQEDVRQQIVSAYGSIAGYLGSMVTEMIEEPSPDLLKPFYALYERSFPLAEEREPLSGFTSVLAFNTNQQVQGLFGPTREVVMALRAPGSDVVVAAANYMIMMYPGPQRPYFGFDGSCQLNFLCVDAELRGMGFAQRLLDQLDLEVRRVVAEATGVAEPDLFFTIEQNNPARMTSGQIEEDAAAALIDPLERMRWWAKRGYRKLEFEYEQPPLSPDHKPCSYIDYFVRFPKARSSSTPALPASALLEHLRRFFFVGVGKFEIDMKRNAQWIRQKADLESRSAVPIVPLQILVPFELRRLVILGGFTALHSFKESIDYLGQVARRVSVAEPRRSGTQMPV